MTGPNRGPLELEATALPTEPQPLPHNQIGLTIGLIWSFCSSYISSCYVFVLHHLSRKYEAPMSRVYPGTT